MARVSITRAEKDPYIALTKVIAGLGEKFISPGDSVLLKPNLLEPQDPDSGEITTPRIMEAVARYCLECGADRVIIGDGPSYYQPESRLRECFTTTGVSEVAAHLGIEWVLFDEHDYRTFRGIPGCPREFRVTEFAFNCDKLINLPALKTHYQTTVTLAMKNLKGCLKREDKPRFHREDLSRAITELNRIIRPTLNIIDGTAKTIGNVGYSGDKQPGIGLLIAGTDIVAVDAVGCALMGIDPAEVRTVTLGAAVGLGESDLTRLDIVGEELKNMKLRVRLPQEELRQMFPLLEIVGIDKACTGCFIPLVSGLLLLGERGIKLKRPLRIYLGEAPESRKDKGCLLVGDCALVEGDNVPDLVGGCPPTREDVLHKLTEIMSES
ncbi:MAG: hypothetical protein CL874_01565 [Dehalococcoidales bacterium]|jgi:uncharacterized protein (DUF362 family)|nr:hypothetical protein [Dehalococcoidales bacterium]MDP6577481.1 DUF362 domain-containing protein [Dehalococcoidales bacterium]MDP6824922.1 DUF362 domain-containing protein [Dehalococcoidales bacterium]